MEAKFNQTYGAAYNIVTSGRSENRLFSDLSSKLGNTKTEGALIQNPFQQNQVLSPLNQIDPNQEKRHLIFSDAKTEQEEEAI